MPATSRDNVAQVWAAIDSEPDWAVELAAQMVRIPSVNPRFSSDGDIAGGEARVQALLAGELEALGLATRRFDALPGRPNLVAKTEGGGDPARSLILCGHVDVVPVGDLSYWSWPPFGGEIRDGRLLGRGAQDMKAGLAACVGAIRAIRKAGLRLDGQLSLHSVVDEEAGGAGAKAMVAAGELAAAAIVAEPANGEIHVCQGGLEWLRVTIRGRQGHSAYRFAGYWPQPHEKRTGAEPISAADLATRFLVALRDYEASVARWKSHPLMAPGVNHFGVGAMWIGAGLRPDGLPEIMSNPGITPDAAVIDIDMKFLPQETSASARAEFEAFVAAFSATDPWFREHPISVAWDLYGLHFPPLDTSPGHPLVGALQSARPRLRPAQTPVRGSVGVTDAAHYAVAGVAALRYGPFGANQHGADEWADVASIRETTKALAAAVVEWCGVRPANGD